MAVERFHHFDGQLLSVTMVFHEVGDFVATHEHMAPHTMVVPLGALDVTENGALENYDASGLRPKIGTIPEHVPHGLTCTKAPAIAFCVLAPLNKEGRPMTREEMAGLSAFDLWKAMERV